jgi:hypothetical protein
MTATDLMRRVQNIERALAQASACIRTVGVAQRDIRRLEVHCEDHNALHQRRVDLREVRGLIADAEKAIADARNILTDADKAEQPDRKERAALAAIELTLSETISHLPGIDLIHELKESCDKNQLALEQEDRRLDRVALARHRDKRDLLREVCGGAHKEEGIDYDIWGPLALDRSTAQAILDAHEAVKPWPPQMDVRPPIHRHQAMQVSEAGDWSVEALRHLHRISESDEIPNVFVRVVFNHPRTVVGGGAALRMSHEDPPMYSPPPKLPEQPPLVMSHTDVPDEPDDLFVGA